jgi:hypothetical protein
MHIIDQATHPSDNPGEQAFAIIVTAIAAVVSWQEQSEWFFRILSLLLASVVSAIVLIKHYNELSKKNGRRRRTK